MTGPRGPHQGTRWLDDTCDLADQDYASGHLTEFWRARIEALLELLEAAEKEEP